VRSVRWLVSVACLPMLIASCGGKQPSHPPEPTPASSSSRLPPIPEGVYRLVVTSRDADTSANPHVVALSEGLIGSYELSLSGGSYKLTLNGRDSVPYVVPSRPGIENGYLRYGWWVGAGVPPIGHGSYNGDQRYVAFHSARGACLLSGASPAIGNGLYRWRLDGSALVLEAASSGEASSESSLGAFPDDCLGRAYVLTVHPWARVGG
jgi:hypothetical protein